MKVLWFAALLAVVPTQVLAQAQLPPPPSPSGAAATDLPPPPPPPPPSEAPPPPAVVEPAGVAPRASDALKEPGRFSRFSAGRGGALFVTAEVLAGMVGGGVLGAGLVRSSGASDLRQGVFFGLLGGGLALGTTVMAVQYFHGIGLSCAGAISLATGVGGLLGLGIMVGAAPTGSLAGWGGALLGAARSARRWRSRSPGASTIWTPRTSRSWA